MELAAEAVGLGVQGRPGWCAGLGGAVQTLTWKLWAFP